MTPRPDDTVPPDWRVQGRARMEFCPGCGWPAWQGSEMRVCHRCDGRLCLECFEAHEAACRPERPRFVRQRRRTPRLGPGGRPPWESGPADGRPSP
jgi:hypothetical protein